MKISDQIGLAVTNLSRRTGRTAPMAVRGAAGRGIWVGVFGGALFVFAPRRNGVASLLKKRYTELDL